MGGFQSWRTSMLIYSYWSEACQIVIWDSGPKGNDKQMRRVGAQRIARMKYKTMQQSDWQNFIQVLSTLDKRRIEVAANSDIAPKLQLCGRKPTRMESRDAHY